MKYFPSRAHTPSRRDIASLLIVVSLLALGFPYSLETRASGEAKHAVVRERALQGRIEEKRIEQRNTSDEVTARLQVFSESPREATFSVEDVRAPINPKVAAAGSVSLTEHGFLVNVQDTKSNTRLAMKFQAGRTIAEGATMILKFNGARYKLAIDLTKARDLAEESRNLRAAGERIGLTQLKAKAIGVFSSPDDYLSFVRQVETSPAFESVALMISLFETSAEEVNKSAALLAVSYAAKVFAPAAYKSYQTNRATVKARDLVLSVGHSRKAPSSAAVPVSPISCEGCIEIWTNWTMACFDLFNICPIPPDSCFDIALACLAAADAFLFSCARDCSGE